jgi:hypothetical protein
MAIIREVRNHGLITDFYGLNSLLDLRHDADCFVPYCPWRCRTTEFAMEGVQICTTNHSLGDAEDGVGGVFDLGFRDGGDGHVEGFAFPEDSTHGVLVVVIIVIVIVVSSRHAGLNENADSGSGCISSFDESIKVLLIMRGSSKHNMGAFIAKSIP